MSRYSSLLIAMILAQGIARAQHPTQKQRQWAESHKSPSPDFGPVVEYSEQPRAEPPSAEEVRKGARFDRLRPRNFPIRDILIPGMWELPVINHWYNRVPALPVAESVVVIGEVKTAE